MCATILIAAFQQAAAQGLEQRGTPIAWQYSRRVPAGTIRGVIMNEDGTPLPGAHASIAGRRTGVLSGSDGRFELTGVSTGPAEFRIESMGHKWASIDLVIPADAGVTVYALLPQQGIGGRCELAEQILLPLVEVVDSVTGAAPGSPPTLRLERGELSLTPSPSRPPEPDAPVPFFSPPIESSGAYRMTVTAAGYRTWVRDNVRIDVVPGLCGNGVRHDRFVARLVPLR